MIRFTVKLAGRAIEVTALYEATRQACGDFLCGGPGELSVAITEADLAFEKEKSAREARIEGLPEPDFGPETLELTALLRAVTEKLFAYDTLLFHGSAICVDGEVYLFTAKSGTGKSTHTRLWRQLLGSRAVTVNDDKPFLRLGAEEVTVCGNPWNGKHGLGCNMQAPLRAICILERGTENRICRIPAKEALRLLLQQSSRPRSPALLPKYMELIDALSGAVAFYRLQCNMEPSAAKVATARAGT